MKRGTWEGGGAGGRGVLEALNVFRPPLECNNLVIAEWPENHDQPHGAL